MANVENSELPQAASLTCADEVLMRCAPVLCSGIGAGPDKRDLVATLIERHKRDAIVVLTEVAEALESNSEINKHTGMVQMHVDPEWFGKFQRALERHTGRRVEL